MAKFEANSWVGWTILSFSILVGLIFLAVIALQVSLSVGYMGWPFHAYLDSIGMYDPRTGEEVRCRRAPDEPKIMNPTPAIRACIAEYSRKGFVQGSKPKERAGLHGPQ